MKQVRLAWKYRRLLWKWRRVYWHRKELAGLALAATVVIGATFVLRAK